jgi:hypothetical protein
VPRIAQGQPAGFDHRVAAGVPQPAGEQRGVQLPACRGRVEHLDLMAEGPGGRRLLGQAVELPRRDREVQLAGQREVAVDAVGGDRLADLAQVLRAEPLEQRHFVGEPFQAVGQPVGEARRAEAAVAPGRRPAGRARLEQHHVEGRVALPRQQRRPQPGEAAAHDRQVGGDAAGERGQRVGRVRLVEPERPRRGARQRPRHLRIDHRPTFAHREVEDRRRVAGVHTEVAAERTRQ